MEFERHCLGDDRRRLKNTLTPTQTAELPLKCSLSCPSGSVEFMKQVFPKFWRPQAPGRAQTPPVLTERARSGLGSASCSASWPQRETSKRAICFSFKISS